MRNNGVRLGRILGVEIRLDYSWFIIFFLIGWTFTSGLLPNLFPELGILTTVILGIVATLLFFVSIVIHELSHSLYAKSQGLRIRRITLFIFGGAAEIMDEAKSPRQEFMIAAVGPLASMVLSLFFAGVWLVGVLAPYTPLVAIGSILASINFVLAVFNVLPGYPLDGGRMFRAVVWKATGSLEKATRYAAIGGQVLAFVLIVYGIFQIAFLNFVGGLWMILIGVFLNYAATANRMQAQARIRLKDVSVEDLMERSLDSKVAEEFILTGNDALHPKDPSIKAMEIMSKSGRTNLPVVQDNVLIGVLTADSIRRRVAGKRQ
jgi:Zn-dependent protease